MADESRPQGGELARLTPEVRTLAKPQAVPLIGARGVVHRSPTLKAAFQQARAEGWTPEQLAGAITPELERALECEPEAAVEVAQYLADEYFQLGDAVLVCDRTTGKAIARISDTDLYQPPEQRRESGAIVKPLPRLNPNLEGFLVSYIFEQERDRQIRDEVLARLPHTEFLSTDLDPRVRPVTRAGRLGIAQNVRAALPSVLEAVQGSARTFLEYFDHVETPPEGFDVLPRRTAEAHGRQNIVDPKAMNLRFSWEATIKARTGVSWVREMAAHVVKEARTRVRADHRLTVAHPLLDRDHVAGRAFWTGDPSALRAIQTIPEPEDGMAAPAWAHFQTFPCTPGEPELLGFHGVALGRVGAIIIHPEAYDFQTREIHGRWEMVAKMDYTICINWDRVTYLRITDIPIKAIGEIL
jgi:hypothetical protein